MKSIWSAGLLCLFLGVALPAAAVDAPPIDTTAEALMPARAQIAERRWVEAIATLKRINATRDADWNNLMGYAQRKQDKPDLAAAERYYDAALRLAPTHLGALEYSGELALIKGDLARAEARLAELARICAARCEEHADLKREIDRFKANGNKFVSAP